MWTVHILHKLYFMFFCIYLWIWLPHCKYGSHWPYLLWSYRCDIGIYMCKTHKTATFTSCYCHICQKQIFPHFKYDIYGIYFNEIYREYMCICTTYDITDINHENQEKCTNSSWTSFILLEYVAEQIWLPHCKYRLHCPHSVLTYLSDIGENMNQHNQLQYLFHMLLP